MVLTAILEIKMKESQYHGKGELFKGDYKQTVKKCFETFEMIE